MKYFVVLLSLSVFSAVVLAAPPNSPQNEKSNTSAQKKQEGSVASSPSKIPAKGTKAKESNAVSSQAKPEASANQQTGNKAPANGQTPPKGRGNASPNQSTVPPANKPKSRFVAFRSNDDGY